MKQERILQILKGPHISEKATRVNEKQNQIVFRVTTDSNKSQIKEAVELLFNVKIKSVRVVNVKGKSRRFGQIQGRKSDWKKAYVSLQPGYDINFTSTAE